MYTTLHLTMYSYRNLEEIYEKVNSGGCNLGIYFCTVHTAEPGRNSQDIHAVDVSGSLIQLGQAGVRLQNTLNLISGGELKIKLYEPKALVPPLEIFDAVASGSVDAGWI